MTREEAQQLIKEIGTAWASQNPQTAAMMTEGDFYLLGKSLGNRLVVVGRLDIKDVDRAIDNFEKCGTANGVDGRLSFQPTPRVAPALTRPSNPADDLPDADEPILKNLRCLEDIVEHGANVSRRVLQLGGGADRAGLENVLLGKLNRRLRYIQEHRIHREDLPPDPPSDAPQPGTVIVRAKRLGDGEPRVEAIREQIKNETEKNHSWNPYQQRKRRKLNETLNDLLSDPSKQVFRDRSGGGIEIIKGLDGVIVLMQKAIKEYDDVIK